MCIYNDINKYLKESLLSISFVKARLRYLKNVCFALKPEINFEDDLASKISLHS